MSELLSKSKLVMAFIDDQMSRETAEQQALRKETRKLSNSGMMSRPESDAFLQFLIRLIGARRVIEVGTFTGSGSLAMALALPEDGKVIACDVSTDWTSVGRKHWEKAGVARKIDLRIAPAADTLNALIKDGQAGKFDMAFIDANKTGYDTYYEACLKLVRTGGLLVLDNMLWGGEVADASVHDEDTDALRALNLKVHKDTRVDFCLLSADDGILLARKR
ncbi:MAG TPA: class I SAM-dependent methyltransferase [Dongiaceae bacterium]|nr:class I SAM-dependent methyltransferase [Dongiaceae bacterium]